VKQAGEDAFGLTIAYIKQETIGPLKGLGRFLLWGVVGSIAIAVGVLLLLIGVLRLLQEQTGSTFGGHLSWVPYVAVVVAGLLVAGVTAWRIMAGPAERKLPAAPEPEPPIHSELRPDGAETKEGTS